MSNPNKRAFGSSTKTKRGDVSLDLTTARTMLPLVRGIVKDIVETNQALDRLQPEQENLDRHRRELSWAERARRYAVRDEIQAAEVGLKRAVAELGELGLELMDGERGRVAFPTKINGRQAVFTWQPGEDNVAHWSYAEEEVRRPIPSDWQSGCAAADEGQAVVKISAAPELPENRVREVARVARRTRNLVSAARPAAGTDGDEGASSFRPDAAARFRRRGLPSGSSPFRGGNG